MLFREQYRGALQDYLDASEANGLARADKLGRRAIRLRLGLVDVSRVHHEALIPSLENEAKPAECIRKLAAAQDFFARMLRPIEAECRASRESTAIWRQMNERFEQEVRRIAHSLHDEAGQLTASAYVSLEMLASGLPRESQNFMGRVRESLDQIEDQLRRVSHELRPTILDDLGLVPALEFLAGGISKRTGLKVRVKSPLRARLPAPIETALYRIVQEALNNVCRHARAGEVTIRVEQEGEVVKCLVQDDGVGFNPRLGARKKVPRGLGLIGIQERLNMLNGRLKIISSPGQGTELNITMKTNT